MSIQALVIYKNEINNIGNTLLHHNDNKVSAKGERLKVLADKLHKAIAALSKEVEAQAVIVQPAAITSHISQTLASICSAII